MKKADRLFLQKNYAEATNQYEMLLERNANQRILEQLAICYYNTYNYDKAEEILKVLVNRNPKETYGTNIDMKFDTIGFVDTKFNFMQHHILSVKGDYERSIEQYFISKGQIPNEENYKKAVEKIENFRLGRENFVIRKAEFNSDASDFAAIKKNDSIYFVSDRNEGLYNRRYKWTNRPYLDLYKVATDSAGNVAGQPELFSATINSKLHEGSMCFSKDGSTIYFSSNNRTGGKESFSDSGSNQVQLYKTIKIDNKWSEPEKLGFCSKEYNYQHPILDHQESYLYYSSDEPGSFGAFDLYRVEILVDGSFGTPENLGDTINTPYLEQFPEISQDGNLYFSSNGHFGLGFLDVFVAKINQNGTFSEPLNLGTPINSSYDDFAFSYSNDSTGFFSSNRDDIVDNIYHFSKIGDIFKKEYINQFFIKDSETLEPVPNVVVTLSNSEGEKIYENKLDTNGNFVVNLIPGSYNLNISSFGYESKQDTIQVIDKPKQGLTVLLKGKISAEAIENIKGHDNQIVQALIDDPSEPNIKSIKDKLYFEMPNIYFDFNKWNIREDSKPVLDKLIAKLNKFPSLEIRIKSYTDNRGSDIFNLLLSEKRAQSTKDYLVQFGDISPGRISFKGLGESMPIFDCQVNCTEKMHQENRRSEFEIIAF